MNNTSIIKVIFYVHGEDEVYYFKQKSSNLIHTYKYVDSLYYNIGDKDHKINYEFGMYLYNNRFKDVYSKDIVLNGRVEFISDLEIEVIDY